MSVSTNSPCTVNAFNNYACASDDFSTILECIPTLVDADIGTYQYFGSCGGSRVCGISVLHDGSPSPDCLALSTLQQTVSEQQQQQQNARRNNNNKDYGDVKPGEVGGSCTPGTYTCNLEGTTALVCKHNGIYTEQLGMCASGCSIQCGRPFCDVAPGFVAYCDGQTVGGWVEEWTSTVCEDKTTTSLTESCTDKTSLTEECTDKATTTTEDCTDKTTTSEDCTDKTTTTLECTDKETTSEECTDKETTVDECMEKTTSDCVDDFSDESEPVHIYTDTVWGTVTPTQVSTPYSATTTTRAKCAPRTETTTTREKCVPKTETLTGTATANSSGPIVIPIPIPIIIPIKDKNSTTNASTFGYYDSHAMKGLGGAWMMIGFAAAFHFALDFAFTYFGV
ncbi:hypothetical protein HDU81_005405 [Chytriomyces hyalinus]|nr:hypothetical protein HDU81_005405 [Chytriomyces hyalinus]